MTLRFGLVGAGAIGTAYRDVFAGVEGARLVAIADCRPRAADVLADLLGAASYPSARAMLDGEGLDAVVVCTPPATHAEVALQAIGRGVHVLCEKPLSIDTASAARMLDGAARAGVECAMATKFRFVDDVVRARALVESGILGELIQVENVFTGRVDMRRRWYSDPAVSGGGVLIDNGTHSVDLVRYFLGPIVEVLAVEGPRAEHLAVEDNGRMLLRAESEVLASVELSWSYQRPTDSYLDVYGTQGTLRVGWQASRYRQVGSEEWVDLGTGYDKITCMRGQVEAFCAAVRGERPLAVTADDALASVRVIEAAYASLGSGTWAGVATGSGAAGADAGEQVA